LALETRDILNVELLSTGTFFGIGSGPEGDAYSEADLDAIVVASQALSLKSPVKLGHGSQEFAQAEGLPAVGWVENLRRVGAKLLGDLRGVAGKVADLIEAGGYRTRSSELVWNYKDADGTVWPRVFTGLALLGADIPAVTSLDDMLALYAYEGADVHAYTVDGPGLNGGDSADAESGDDHAYAIMLPLSEKGSFQWIGEQIEQAFPKQPGVWWWSQRTYPQFVVVCKSSDSPAPAETWVVPYTIDAQGTVTLGPQSEWQQVEEEDLFVPVGYAAAETVGEDPDLIAKFETLMSEMEGLIKGKTGAPRLRMWVAEAHKGLAAIIRQQKAAKDAGGAGAPAAAVKNQQEVDTVKEHVYALLGLTEDVSEEDALAKMKERLDQPAPETKGYMSVDSPEYKKLQADAEKGAQAEHKLYERDRKEALDTAQDEGKFLAADRERWEKLYDADPETVKATLAEAKPVLEFKELGSGEGGREASADKGEAIVARATALQADHPEWAYKDCVVQASKEV
jgi:hypothetical protein